MKHCESLTPVCLKQNEKTLGCDCSRVFRQLKRGRSRGG